MRYCRECGLESNDLSLFLKDKRAKNNVRQLCKKCWAKRQQPKTQAARERGREYIKSIKANTPCADCGKFYPHYVMDLDHRDPSVKEFTISQRKTLSIKRLQEEIDKCDIVCANCHRERTHGPEI